MANSMDPDTTALTIVNLAIAACTLLCVLAVIGAIAYELGWRCWMRRSLPRAWPPAPQRGRHARRVVRVTHGKPPWPPLPDAWPPIEEESKR